MSSLPAKARPKAPALLTKTTTMMSVVSAPHPASLESDGVNSDMRFVFETGTSHSGNGMTALSFVAIATVALGAVSWVTMKTPQTGVVLAPLVQPRTLPVAEIAKPAKPVVVQVKPVAVEVKPVEVAAKPLPPLDTAIFLNTTVVPFQVSKIAPTAPPVVVAQTEVAKSVELTTPPVAVPTVAGVPTAAVAQTAAAPVAAQQHVDVARLVKLKSSFEEWGVDHKDAAVQVTYDATLGLMVSFETEWLFKVNSPGMRESKQPAVQHWANAVGQARTEFKSMTVIQWMGDSTTLKNPAMSKSRRTTNLEILRKKLSNLAWVNESNTVLKVNAEGSAPHGSASRTGFLFH
jgi:hypothetical protein